MSKTVIVCSIIKMVTAGNCRWPAAWGDSAPPPSTDQLPVLPREKGAHLDRFGFAYFNSQVKILVLRLSLSHVAHA